jgi:hypothetical protein
MKAFSKDMSKNITKKTVNCECKKRTNLVSASHRDEV